MPMIALLAIHVAGLSAQSLPIVAESRPVAQIVLCPDPDDIERQAANELQTYIEKISGAELPVIEAPEPGVACVYIGAPNEETARALGTASLAYDGFVVDCDGERLILAGNRPRGTRNAVYWALGTLFGVRWYIPTELGENVPRSDTLKVPAMRRREEPRFACRRNHGIDLSVPGAGGRWRDRNRITDHSYAVPFNRYSHWLYLIIPPSKHGETHPEYFPLIDGERRVPDSDISHGWQPCTSNPEVVALTIEYGRQWFKDHPEANFLSVGMNDSAAFCECEACTALDVPEATFRGKRMLSDRYFTFVKTVADGLRDEFPDKYVSSIAYWTVEAPPKRVTLPDNTLVVITQDVAQWHDPGYKRADMEFARAWADAPGEFGTYDYTGLGWVMPRVYPHAMADSLRFYDEMGAVAVTNEAFPTWWYAGPQMYVRARLMWDPSLDCDAVLNEFYAGFFGPARRPMRRFYEALEGVMNRERPGLWFEGLGSVLQQLDLWRPADLRACRQALSRANEAASQSSPHDERVEFVARGFSWPEAMLEEFWQAQTVLDLPRSAKPGRRLVAVQQLLELTDDRERAWESIEDDALISGIYNMTHTSFAGRLASWHSYVESALSQGTLGVLAHSADLTADEIEALCAAAPDRVARSIRAMQWVAANPDAPNLCGNPGFEATEAEGPPPEGVDWVSTDAPPGWSKWTIEDSTIDQLEWQPDGGRDGSQCVKLAGTRNGCFIQAIPVTPGEVCHASAWARTTESAEFQVRLTVRWQDADGAWTADGSDQWVDAAGGHADWRKLSVVATVPEGAGFAVLLLGALDQEADDAVWYDDARFVKLPADALD